MCLGINPNLHAHIAFVDFSGTKAPPFTGFLTFSTRIYLGRLETELAFLWDEEDSSPRIVGIDWQSGEPTTTIILMESEALHLLAFSAIEVLDVEMFKRVNPEFCSD